jgi:hypothetical protein
MKTRLTLYVTQVTDTLVRPKKLLIEEIDTVFVEGEAVGETTKERILFYKEDDNIICAELKKYEDEIVKIITFDERTDEVTKVEDFVIYRAIAEDSPPKMHITKV